MKAKEGEKYLAYSESSLSAVFLHVLLISCYDYVKKQSEG